MAGFSSIEGNTFGSVMYADNASFDGTPRNGVMSANGELWIGANSAPYVRKNTLTAGTGISITNGAGSITIANTAPSTALTITGNTGGSLSPTAGNWNIITNNTTLKFAGSVSTLTQEFSIPNLLLGSAGSNITTALNNIGIGQGALPLLTSGFGNISIGPAAMGAMQNGGNNVAIGYTAMNAANGSGCNNNVAVGVSSMSSSLTSANNTAVGYQALALLRGGASNTAVGTGSFVSILDGTQNVGLGYFAGHAYTGSESNNICIGYNVIGTIGESNICRIGNSSITNTYLQGIVSLPKGQVVNVTRPGAYPYTVLSTDYIVSVDTSSAANTINLPASPVQGEVHIVKDLSANASVNNITVSGNGNNIIGTTSAASQTISLNGASVTYVYDTSVWLAI